MEKTTFAPRGTRRFANFVQTLFCASQAQGAPKTYAKVVEHTGNLILVDLDEIAKATVSGTIATIETWNRVDEEDDIFGVITNPDVLTSRATCRNADGTYVYVGENKPAAPEPKAVAAIRIRPLGQGDFIEDRRFVELQFRAGGFLRAIAATEEAMNLEQLILAGTSPVIEWRAGTHEIWIRRDQLLGCEIDRHEPEGDSSPAGHAQAGSDDDELNFRLVTSEGLTTDILLTYPPQPLHEIREGRMLTGILSRIRRMWAPLNMRLRLRVRPRNGSMPGKGGVLELEYRDNAQLADLADMVDSGPQFDRNRRNGGGNFRHERRPAHARY